LIKRYISEWKRVLKPNGTIFCFCASEMSARIELAFAEHFNVLAQVVWTKPNDPGFDGWKQKMKKEALRQWYAHSERIIFAEPAIEGNLYRSYFGNLLREMRVQAGLSQHQLTGMTGAYGKVNHGGAVSNWEAGRNIPSREQYTKICEALLSTGKVESMPLYEDAIRPFSVDSSKEFTDIWTFPSVRPYKGKHPAEKPGLLLEHAIEATTFPGDIVLDCFAGSGSTAQAARRLGRRAVAVELESRWVDWIAAQLDLKAAPGHRLEHLLRQNALEFERDNYSSLTLGLR
jgi:adenine-specific DNA-methyltransferase